VFRSRGQIFFLSERKMSHF